MRSRRIRRAAIRRPDESSPIGSRLAGLVRHCVVCATVPLQAGACQLEARDEVKTGNKAWLRRRLHAAIVREHLVPTDDDGGRSEGRARFGP